MLFASMHSAMLEHSFYSPYQMGRYFFVTMPPLVKHIKAIVPWRPKKQMARPHAKWIIAFMQNPHPFWNGAKFLLPYPSRCCMHFAIYAKCWVRRAALIMAAISCPYPTFFCLSDIPPKSYLKGKAAPPFEIWASFFHKLKCILKKLASTMAG